MSLLLNQLRSRHFSIPTLLRFILLAVFRRFRVLFSFSVLTAYLIRRKFFPTVFKNEIFSSHDRSRCPHRSPYCASEMHASFLLYNFFFLTITNSRVETDLTSFIILKENLTELLNRTYHNCHKI